MGFSFEEKEEKQNGKRVNLLCYQLYESPRSQVINNINFNINSNPFAFKSLPQHRTQTLFFLTFCFSLFLPLIDIFIWAISFKYKSICFNYNYSFQRWQVKLLNKANKIKIMTCVEVVACNYTLIAWYVRCTVHTYIYK